MNWKWILAHAVFIYSATYLGGFLMGFALSVSGVSPDINDPGIRGAIGLSNIIFIFLVVLIIALVQKPTWKHLLYVWLLLAAASIPNLFIMDSTLPMIFLGVLLTAIVGAISNLLGIGILKTTSYFSNKSE